MGKQWEQFSGRGKGGALWWSHNAGNPCMRVAFPHPVFVLYHDRCSKNSLLPIVCRFAWITFPTPTLLRVMPAIPRTLVSVMPASLSYPPPPMLPFRVSLSYRASCCKAFFSPGIIFFSLRALYPSRPEPGGLIIKIFLLVRRRKQRRRRRRRRRRPQLPIHQVWRGSDGRGGDPGGHLHLQVDGVPGLVAGGGCCQRWLSCGVAWRLAALSIYISPPPPF